MRVIYGISALEEAGIHSSTITVGTFDGVHKGHKVLLQRLTKAAAERNMPSVIVTFDPHPQMVLGTRGPIEILTTTEEKLSLLEPLNPDIVVVLEFNQQLASLEADDFIERILVEDLGLKHFVMGYDHNFGKGRQGNFELVKSNAKRYNYTFEEVGPVHNGFGPVKSSGIRKALAAGEYNQAVGMLGYSYFITGEVIRGRGMGKKLGFPTININVPPGKLLPKSGVYAAWVKIEEKTMPGMAYVGGRLTFGDETITVEANLFDFNGDLSGRKVKMILEQYTRAPKKFDSIEQLQAAMVNDRTQVKIMLNI